PLGGTRGRSGSGRRAQRPPGESPVGPECSGGEGAPLPPSIPIPRRSAVYGDDATVRKILTELGDTWAVVGLSSNRQRAAYGVAQVLQRFGKRIRSEERRVGKDGRCG